MKITSGRRGESLNIVVQWVREVSISTQAKDSFHVPHRLCSYSTQHVWFPLEPPLAQIVITTKHRPKRRSMPFFTVIIWVFWNLPGVFLFCSSLSDTWIILHLSYALFVLLNKLILKKQFSPLLLMIPGSIQSFKCEGNKLNEHRRFFNYEILFILTHILF